MGDLTPGSAHARPCAQYPIETSGIFWRQCIVTGQQKIKKHPVYSILTACFDLRILIDIYPPGVSDLVLLYSGGYNREEYNGGRVG
jgi:hypothetical protein